MLGAPSSDHEAPPLSQIAGAELSLCCKFCGGSLVNTQTAEDMHAGLTTFKNVAKYHNFQLLLETTEWLLRPLQ